MTEFMDRYLDYLESTTPEQRLREDSHYGEREADRLADALRVDLTCPECNGYVGTSCVCEPD